MVIKAISEAIVESEKVDMLEESINILKDYEFLPEDYENDADMLSKLREYSESKLLTFDCECIEDSEDYSGLFSTFVEHSNSNNITNISSHYDYDNETAIISCTVNGEKVESSWKQDSDWVTEEFFEFANTVFEKLGKKYIVLPAEDQCAECLILDKEPAEKVSEYFKRRTGRIDPDHESGLKIVTTFFISIIGFIVTVIIGWFTIGFWVSFGLGLLFWGVFTIWKAFRIVNEQKEEEDFTNVLQNNPELIGKMAVEYMNELKKEASRK